MKINEITINALMSIPGDPLRFRVGDPIFEGGHVVEKINYHPISRTFNKGLEVSGGCYAVYLIGTPNRRIIMEATVTSIDVVKEVKATATNTEANVTLPEN